MAAIKYRELKRRYELDGARSTCRHLEQAIGQRHLRAEDFSIRELFEALVCDAHAESCGYAVLKECFDPRGPQNLLTVLEAAHAVDTSTFSSITGQIVFSKILEGFNSEAFVASRLVDTVPTRL